MCLLQRVIHAQLRHLYEAAWPVLQHCAARAFGRASHLRICDAGDWSLMTEPLSITPSYRRKASHPHAIPL